ncbi:MAG: hypothetical protein ACRCX2_33895 [Paraclostridium sp.]
MKLFERTKVYTLSEFRNLEARREVAEVDKQIGIWKKTNKKLYRFLIIITACFFFTSSFTVLPQYMEYYNILMKASKYGIQISLLINILFDTLFYGKNSVEEIIKDSLDGLSIYGIFIAFITLVCSTSM